MRRPLALALLVACGGRADRPLDEVVLSIDLPGAEALDPKLGAAEMPIDVNVVSVPEDQACSGTLSALAPNGQQRVWNIDATGASVVWDGRDDDGFAFDPAQVILRATLGCEAGARSTVDAVGWILRLGITEIDLTDSGDGGHVEVAFHKTGFRTYAVQVIDEAIPELSSRGGTAALAELDDNLGQPRPLPEPWLDPDVPPWGDRVPGDRNLPAAYVAGSVAQLDVVAGTRAVSERFGVAVPAIPEGAPPIRLVAEGLDQPPGSITPGTPLAFTSAVLPDVLGRHSLEVTWRFQVMADGTRWEDIPGEVHTTHRLYMVAGQSALRGGGEADGFAPPVPWIGVLEDLADDLDGVAPEDGPILDALREYLHHNEWVIYNPNDGAYSGFKGQYIYWEYAWSDLSEWLDRYEGVDLYCHSMSCLLSVLANSVGVGAEQYVLGVSFRTNQTRAAGREEWRRWSFNSHSVVSPDDFARVWDASIDIDGDDDPANQPVEALSPLGLDGDEYLWRLSYDDIGVVNRGRCYVY